MSLAQFTNNSTTTLASALSSSATTCTVATGTGALFPTLTGSQYFSATLWSAGNTTGVPNEIVHVTARSGDTMTIARAQEGTTAQAWNVGDTFANYVTAAFLGGLAQEVDIQQQVGNAAVDTGTLNAGVVTLNPSSASLASLLYSPIRVLKMATANSGAYTLNVDAHGVEAVTYLGQPLVSGMLAASQIFEVFWDGTNFELLGPVSQLPYTGVNAGSYTFASITVGKDGRVSAASSGTVFTPTYANFQNQQGSGVNSPESLTSGAWTQRTLNTTVFNSISGASLSGNTFTLPAGTYEFNISTPISRNGNTAIGQSRLYNVSSSTAVQDGTSVSVGTPYGANSTAWSNIIGLVTISGSTVFDIQTYASVSSGGTQGGGVAASSGDVEVYTTCYIRKIA